MDITIYFVGDNEADALQGLPFDSEDSADSYRWDTDKSLKIFSASVTVNESDLHLA